MMDQELARIYGTPGALSDEDLEKQAEAELFVKLAGEEGIDINQLSDEQVAELYAATFEKDAGEMPPQFQKGNGNGESKKDEEKEEKAEEKEEDAEKKAQAEFAAIQEWQEKCAEADKLGRIMAHSYVQELGKIGEAVEQGETESETPEQGEGAAEAEGNEPPALDQVAAQRAVEKAAEAGFNPDEAIERINALYTLGGPGESEKIASAQNYEGAVELRALEILDKAGFPVQW